MKKKHFALLLALLSAPLALGIGALFNLNFYLPDLSLVFTPLTIEFCTVALILSNWKEH